MSLNLHMVMMGEMEKRESYVVMVTQLYISQIIHGQKVMDMLENSNFAVVKRSINS